MAAPLVWTDEARDLVHRLWECGERSAVISGEVSRLLEVSISVRAIVAQAAKMGSLRPSSYRAETARSSGALGGSAPKRFGPSASYLNPALALEFMQIRRLERGPVDHGNVLPTVRSDPSLKDVPYKMASSGPDPFREVRRRQAQRGSVGRL